MSAARAMPTHTTFPRLWAGCEDDAIAGRHLSPDVLREVARSLSADGFPALSRYLARPLD